jgi:predicted extracellular nuclease
MNIHLATFNIFWYPSSKVPQNQRSDADQARLGRVLTTLDAHAMVFQEILDHGRLESLLGSIAGHDYRLRQKPGGAWLTSGNAKSKASMKIVCAYDATVLELVAAAALRNPNKDPAYKGRRDPYAMHLRVAGTAAEFTLVGVHLKSGLPNAGDKDPDAQVRRREAAFLASWLAGAAELEPGSFQRPPTEDVIVLGDCNAMAGNWSLGPLHDAPLDGWHWPSCQVMASLDPLAPVVIDDANEQWSTFLDRMVIDHALVSPAVSPRISSALIYAFDLDPALDEEPAGEDHWLRGKTDYQAKPYGDAKYQPVENLYRISDHRPVRIALNLA